MYFYHNKEDIMEGKCQLTSKAGRTWNDQHGTTPASAVKLGSSHGSGPWGGDGPFPQGEVVDSTAIGLLHGARGWGGEEEGNFLKYRAGE